LNEVAARVVSEDRPRFRAALAAVTGNTLEYYDYFIFSAAAALVIGPLFFPSSDPAAMMIAALASYAAGFLSRPLGALVFGHMGDRYGRKSIMVWTLRLMGIATFSIGLLPSHAQIGVAASLLLLVLRLLQGFAAGGEWGGAVLMTTENAPPGRRGLWGAFSQAGTGLGFVLACGAFYLVERMPRSEFLDWGWRLPFLASVVIFAIGWYIRNRVSESEEFEKAAARKSTRAQPLRDLLRNNPREVFIGAGLRLAEFGGSHLMTAFAMAYGTMVGASASLLLGAVVVSLIVDVVMMIFFGWLSDRIGRRAIYLGGIIVLGAIGYPVYAAIAGGDPVKIFATLIIANGVAHAAMIGVQPSMLTELFPVNVRSSGIASAQAIAAIGAGFLPMSAAALYSVYRSPVPIALLILGLCIISATALLFASARSATARE
jgi:MHS family shikimate/dehydroshikimate transporter-like MFS transporter